MEFVYIMKKLSEKLGRYIEYEVISSIMKRAVYDIQILELPVTLCWECMGLVYWNSHESPVNIILMVLYNGVCWEWIWITSYELWYLWCWKWCVLRMELNCTMVCGESELNIILTTLLWSWITSSGIEHFRKAEGSIKYTSIISLGLVPIVVQWCVLRCIKTNMLKY